MATSQTISKDDNHIFLVILVVVMKKGVAAKNTTWHHIFKLKYAHIRPEKSFWSPPAFQLKIFDKPSGDHYVQDQAKMT